MDKINELNKKYEKLAENRVYPFIAKNRVTILAEGFYQKSKSNYRGISFIYDHFQEKHKAILIGYYYVPKDILVVPLDLLITEAKNKLIDDKVRKGFEIIRGFPSLLPYEFLEDSEEYKEARLKYMQFKTEL
jgi:hypothetical protein